MALNSSLCEGAMAGDYRIVRKLAEGGMGEVFIVRDTTQGGDSTCVLKSVLCASNGDAKEALKEAKVLKDIRHPHVVQYLDVFPNQEAYKGIIAVCTVMEYCERGDLAAHLSNLKKRQNGGGKGLKEPAIIMWVSQLLQALAHLHSIQIIHRDMKPHNVFITSKCNLKIGDFGLAKSLERSKATSRVGTPAYIAPEVLQYDVRLSARLRPPPLHSSLPVPAAAESFDEFPLVLGAA
jgi:serine/threonine protein kinase